MRAIHLFFGSLFISICIAQDWKAVDTVLEDAIKDGAFPGCVALAASEKGVLYWKAFGNFTYGIPPPYNRDRNPPMTLLTLFDMASCTKVTATTSAIAQFYQRGELDLNSRISKFLGPDFDQNGKAEITVLNCLLHNSGFPPDPNPNYNSASFGCPETKKDQPEENFSCSKQIYASLMSQTLSNPIGTTYVYSDLSMITLMYVIGHLAKSLKYVDSSELIPECHGVQDTGAIYQCYYEAYVRKHVFEFLEMKSSQFLPPHSKWAECAPAENDTSYLHRVIQGQVSDGNAYALGGIAGHAGLFSNSRDLLVLMKRLMFAKDNDNFLNRTTVDFFTKEYNHSQSSRALGWNTNDPTVFDEGWGLLCGSMSPKTWMHVGFTGTQLCGDPDRKLFTIFLTNRVYPTASNTKIANVRRKFNTAIVDAFDKMISQHQ